MALKTFNINGELYKEFSTHCKEHGISMSKKIEKFIREELVRLQSEHGIVKKEKVVKKFSGKLEDRNMLKYC